MKSLPIILFWAISNSWIGAQPTSESVQSEIEYKVKLGRLAPESPSMTIARKSAMVSAANQLQDLLASLSENTVLNPFPPVSPIDANGSLGLLDSITNKTDTASVRSVDPANLKLQKVAIPPKSPAPNAGQKYATFSSSPNDWIEKFEFRALKKPQNADVSTVFLVITSDLKNFDGILQDSKWSAFSSRKDIGIVSLGYELQKNAPEGKGINAISLSKENPKKAREIIGGELQKQIAEQYPNAKKFAYFIHEDNAWIAINKIIESPKSTLFWVMEDFVWGNREKSRSVPMGLVINRNRSLASSMLEAHQANRSLKHEVTFIRDVSKDRESIDKFIVNYINVALEEQKRRPIVADLETKVAFLNSPPIEKIANTTWLPDASLLGSWQAVHMLDKQERLPDIFEEPVKTNIPQQPEIILYLKMPLLSANDHVKGVLCLSTWMNEKQSMYDVLRRGAARGDLLDWADRNQMAVITWNVKTLWPVALGQAELERAEARLYAKTSDELALAWDKGIRALITKHKIPGNNYFCYGLSRGSLMAHRIVIRKPERFLAVHFHVANSFDIPTEKAKNVLWLISTGELDGGYQASIDFFRKCQILNYPIIVKAGENLGHAESDETNKLGLAFFQYALDLKNLIPDNRISDAANQQVFADKTRSDLSRSKFFGDFINQEVYQRGKADWIPEGQRVPMISETVANAWGRQAN